MEFEGKVILVTGAASGIGADAARYLAHLGGKIAMVDKNEKLLNEAADRIKLLGYQTPLPIVADVTKDADRIIEETIKNFGQLNVLINSAGILGRDYLTNMKMEDFDKMIDINLRSIIALTQSAIPYLEKTKGNIVNIASVLGRIPETGQLAYCVSKAAVITFTKCVAVELGPKGIRVNAVGPGIIRTPILKSIGITPERAENQLDMTKLPIGRIGEVEETSYTIAYLASDRSTFVTGSLILCDGGHAASYE